MTNKLPVPNVKLELSDFGESFLNKMDAITTSQTNVVTAFNNQIDAQQLASVAYDNAKAEAAKAKTEAEKAANIAAEPLNSIRLAKLQSPLLAAVVNGKLDSAVSITRSTPATYFDIYDVMRTAPINTPRIEKEGLLIEGGSTNLLLRSNDFTNSTWFKSAGLTVTPIANGAPDKVSNAFKAAVTSNPHTACVSQTIGPDQVAHTVSAYIQKDTSSTVSLEIDMDGSVARVDYNFDTSMTTVLNATAEVIKRGDSIRLILKPNEVPGMGPAHVRIYPCGFGSIATGSTIIAMAQCEALPISTSYVESGGSAGVRTKDSITFNYDGNHANMLGGQFSYFITFKPSHLNGLESPIFGGLDGSRFTLLRIKANDNALKYYGSGSGVGVNLNDTDIVCCCVAVDGDDCSVFVGDEQSQGVRELIADEGHPTQVGIGRAHGNTTFYGHIRTFLTYDTALTHAEYSLLREV